MKRRLIPRKWLGLSGILTAVVGFSVIATAQTVELMTTPGTGVEPAVTGNGSSVSPVVSRDGSVVVFVSQAENLVAQDTRRSVTGSYLDVFVHDLTAQETELISVNPSGLGGNGHSYSPVVSQNGEVVVFQSRADDLVSGDDNGADDIFVRDLTDGVTHLISVNREGTGSGNGKSANPIMTPHGRFVAFESEAEDLVADDGNGLRDVFVRDLQEGRTVLVSVGARGSNPMTQLSRTPVISDDGRYVAFESTAPGLAAGEPNLAGEVYLRDLEEETTEWINVNLADHVDPSYQNSFQKSRTYHPVINQDGSRMAFKINARNSFSIEAWIFYRNNETGAVELISHYGIGRAIAFSDRSGPVIDAAGRYVAFERQVQYNPGRTRIMLWDAEEKDVEPVSVNLDGDPVSGDTPRMGVAGDRVMFRSKAENIVPNETGERYQWYMHDLNSGNVELVSVDRNEQGAEHADAGGVPTLSDDGRFVAFESLEDDIVAGDDNNAYDVFVRDFGRGSTRLISERAVELPNAAASGFSSIEKESLSVDGRLAAFTSRADDLVAGDANGLQDVFVRDLAAGSIELISANHAGDGSGNGLSSNPVLTPDGRFVAFFSTADDLVEGDTNGVEDVFVLDRQNGEMRKNVYPEGSDPFGDFWAGPVISSTGRYVVAFGSDRFLYWDTEEMSSRVIGDELHSNPPFLEFAISSNGQFFSLITPTFGGSQLRVWEPATESLVFSKTGTTVLFSQFTTDSERITYLTPNEDETTTELFEYDLTEETEQHLATIDTVAFFSPFALSEVKRLVDGRYLLFTSTDENLAAGDMNAAMDVYVHDLQEDQTRLVSVNQAGTGSGNGASDNPTLSDDGRFVVFESEASDLVPQDGNGVPDVFLRDLQTGTTVLLSAEASGLASGNNRSSQPMISPDGSRVIFQSMASDMVPRDYNNAYDLFIYRVAHEPAVDSDGDGMDDGWETDHFGDLARDGSGDADGDGQIDRHEYLAGTGPNDPESVFRGRLVRPGAGGQLTLQWPAQSGRQYRIEYKNRVTDADWQELDGNPTVIGKTGMMTDATIEEAKHRYYRVVLEE